jgi:glycosyltransferase involved in cell wall biosynthesis
LAADCCGCEREVIVVDDCSTDGTWEELQRLASLHADMQIFRSPENQGKGSALRVGFSQALGDVILVQDADLEYDPIDFPALLRPILEDKADVVFGSRFLGGPHRVLYYWHSVGNHFLTALSNMFTDLNMTDMETGYKVFRSGVIKSLCLKENGFGFEPEVIAKVARLGVRIYEIPISYAGRTYAEGKKIGWKDGFKALYFIVRYGLG